MPIKEGDMEQTQLLDANGEPLRMDGFYVEMGRQQRLRVLDEPAVTQGMVVVGHDGEDYENRPELRQQNWPDRLVPVIG